MKKLILSVLLFALPHAAYASSASSTVINNVNTSSNHTNSQITTHTDITVETDGKVSHYSSDEPNKSIHVESNNGKSKIEVNGQEVSENDDGNTQNPTISKSPTPTKSLKSEEKHEKISVLQKFIYQLEQPFRTLFLIFRKT